MKAHTHIPGVTVSIFPAPAHTRMHTTDTVIPDETQRLRLYEASETWKLEGTAIVKARTSKRAVAFVYAASQPHQLV